MNFNKVTFEASYGTSKQLPFSDLPEIAFAGKSNVGKSSLINKFFNRKNLARVSSMPGKTTTVNFFRVEDIRIADLPGYGYAKRSGEEIRRWSDLMEGYFSQGRNLKLVIQLLDMRHDPTKDDETMLGFLAESGYDFVCVLTKSDKLNKGEKLARRNAFADNTLLKKAKCVIEASSQTGEGIEELKKVICEHLE